MKLSQIIKHRSNIDAMTVRPVKDLVYQILHNIVTDVKNNDLQFRNYSEVLEGDLERINLDLDVFQTTLGHMKANCTQLIDEMQPSYFRKSYELYDEMLAYETTDYILNRRLKDVTPEIYEFVNNRVRSYSNWSYPALIIRPGLEDFVETLVGCDPLYLIDQSHELLSPALARFREEYRPRLRSYVMTESVDSPMMSALPDNQFGFCLAYNFFNFRPFEILEKYLAEIYQKLRPGGTLAMTFNNCDLAEGVGLCEANFMCYTPGHMIERLAQKIGYEVHFRYETHVPNTWLELRKPGILSSLRGGQSLGKLAVKENQHLP